MITIVTRHDNVKLTFKILSTHILSLVTIKNQFDDKYIIYYLMFKNTELNLYNMEQLHFYISYGLLHV